MFNFKLDWKSDVSHGTVFALLSVFPPSVCVHVSVLLRLCVSVRVVSACLCVFVCLCLLICVF